MRPLPLLGQVHLMYRNADAKFHYVQTPAQPVAMHLHLSIIALESGLALVCALHLFVEMFERANQRHILIFTTFTHLRDQLQCFQPFCVPCLYCPGK